MARFKVGDKVKFTKDDGTVVTGTVSNLFIEPYGVGTVYDVSLDDKNLIPNIMEIEERYLTPADDYHRKFMRHYYNTEHFCPICGSEWKKTAYGKNIWYDCVKCNKRKEDILGV